MLPEVGLKYLALAACPMSRTFFLIYGHVIHGVHVCTSVVIGHLVLGNECFLLDGVLSECQPPRWKHAFYGMFSSGLIPRGHALYFSLVSVLF